MTLLPSCDRWRHRHGVGLVALYAFKGHDCTPERKMFVSRYLRLSHEYERTESRKPLRLWPGVAAAVLLVLFGYVVPIFVRFAGLAMLWARRAGRLVWWLLFSRARWYERLGAIVVIVLAVIAHKYRRPSVDRRRRDGLLSYILAIPTLSSRSSPGRR